MLNKEKPMIHGIGVSDGISIGKIFKYNQAELVITKETISDVDKEVKLLEESISRSIDELDKLRIKN